MRETVVLVIDDESQIRRVVHNALDSEGTRVIEAASGREGMDMAAAERPHLVILDLGLPDVDGVEVCREIRKWSASPIIVLSARHSDSEKVKLLDSGADDYVTKPFSTSELKARVRVHLRRASESGVDDASSGKIEKEGLIIDLIKPSMIRDGNPVHLTRTEWDLLRVLARHRGRTMTHQQIFRGVWGNSYRDAQQNLRVHIRSLRRKIEADPVRPTLIITEPGVGYRLEC
jgi:two-component system KDP operon response regulator KdpE